MVLYNAYAEYIILVFGIMAACIVLRRMYVVANQDIIARVRDYYFVSTLPAASLPPRRASTKKTLTSNKLGEKNEDRDNSMVCCSQAREPASATAQARYMARRGSGGAAVQVPTPTLAQSQHRPRTTHDTHDTTTARSHVPSHKRGRRTPKLAPPALVSRHLIHSYRRGGPGVVLVVLVFFLRGNS